MGRRAGTPWARALGVVVLIGIAASALASGAEPQGTWSEVAQIPTERNGLAAGVVSGKLYALGGVIEVKKYQYQDTALAEVYDPTTNTWAGVAPMPTARSCLAAGVVAGKLYAVGGDSGGRPGIGTTDKVEVYDPAMNAWATVAPMLTARKMLAAGVVDGKLYALGGDDGKGNILDTMEVYDPDTDTWSTAAPMPTGRHNFAVGVAGGKLYAVGGSSGPNIWLDTVDVYDPATNTWAGVAPMPTARSCLAVGGLGDKLYAVGGEESADIPYLATMEAYDPGTNTWDAVAPLPLYTNRTCLAVGAVDDKLYAVGGVGYFGFIDVVNAYDPANAPVPPSPGPLPSECQEQYQHQRVVCPAPEVCCCASASFGECQAPVQCCPPDNPKCCSTVATPTPTPTPTQAPSPGSGSGIQPGVLPEVPAAGFNGALIGGIVGGVAVALVMGVGVMVHAKRHGALYRQQAARLTMARASASPPLASV